METGALISEQSDNSLSNLSTEKKVTTPYYNSVYQLILSEAIRLHPNLKGVIPKRTWFYPEGSSLGTNVYVVNTDQAIKTLEKCTTSEEPSPEVPKEKEAELFERSKQALKQAVVAFAKNGDVPPALAASVGRLLRPPDVRITDEDYARFLYTEDEFPKTKVDRASLEMGLKYVYRQIKPFQELLTQHGVKLTEDQIINLILREGAAHEYGHAVDMTLELLEWEEYVSRLPHAERPDRYFYEVRENHHQLIFDTIASNQELTELLSAEPLDGLYTYRTRTSSERVARGFQFLGLKYALLDLGISEEKAEQIVLGFMQRHQDQLEESKQLIQEVRKHNLNLEILGCALNDLRIDLTKRGRNDLYKQIQFGFGAKDLGYYYPLDKKQIKSYISAFWPPKPLSPKHTI